MSDELRRLLRSVTPRPPELDVDRVRKRATAIRRRRRAGQLSLLGAAVLAVGLLVANLLPTEGEIVVGPGPTPTATPSASPSTRHDVAAEDTGPCDDDRRLVADWLPGGFSSQLRPGRSSGPAEGVWHWDGGQGRSIEVHVDVRPYALTPESMSESVLLRRRAVMGPVHEGFMLAWPDDDPPDPQEVCGIAAVVGFGVEQRELFGVGENLRLQEAGAAASIMVRDAELIDSGAGWATTAEGIVRTLDAGFGGWWLATPEDADPSLLRGTTFLDHAHGWSLEVPADGGGQARVWRTVDAGTTWHAGEIELPDPPLGAYGAVHIDFIDREQGWLLASFGANATADQGGALFATDDGGATWQALDPPPASAALTLAHADTAWVVGGPTGGPTRLYVTRDAGASWQQVEVPLPRGWEEAAITHGAPAFWSTETYAGTSGALPVVLHAGERTAAMAVYATVDAGRSWELEDFTELSGPTSAFGPGGPVPFDVAAPDFWVIAAPDGSRIRMRDDLGIRDLDLAGDRLPGPVADVSAPDQNRVWALVLPSDGACGIAGICLGLHLPSNGRWVPARPTGGPPPSGCATDAARRNEPPDDDPSTLDVYFGCEQDGVSFPPAVYRIVRPVPEGADTPAEILRAALQAWLAGPDDTERDRGYHSTLLSDQGDVLAAVTVNSSGVATIDFTGDFLEVSHLNTSHASAVYNRQLLATIFATPGVDAARFTIEGDCEAYSAYFEGEGCPLYRPAGHNPPIGVGER